MRRRLSPHGSQDNRQNNVEPLRYVRFRAPNVQFAKYARFKPDIIYRLSSYTTTIFIHLR